MFKLVVIMYCITCHLPVVLSFIDRLTEVWTAGIPCRMTIWTRSLTCTTGGLVKTCLREEPTDTGEWDFEVLINGGQIQKRENLSSYMI